MVDVVRALHLDMNYTVNGRFHDIVLYGKSLPIDVTMVDLGDEDYAQMNVRILDGNMLELSDFKMNQDKFDNKTIKTKLGSITKTPIGNVMIKPTTAFKGKTDKPILVSKSKIDGVTKSYVSRLKADLPERKASVIDLRFVDTSVKRAEDVLNTLFKVYNKKWMDDINEQAINTSHFIDEELKLIEAELNDVDADISAYKSQNMVPDVGTSTIMNMNKAETTNAQLMELSNQLFMARYIKKQLADENSKYKVLPANSGIESNSVSQQILAYNEKLWRLTVAPIIPLLQNWISR